MAFTIIANLTTISSADDTTGWSGVAPEVWTDFYKEGTACIADLDNVNTDDILYTPSSPLNLSGQHVRVWFQTTTYGYWGSTGGVQLLLTDGTNTALWNIVDINTYSGGWINVLVYADSTPDSGSVDTTNVTSLGIRVNSANKPRRVENCWIDYVRNGDGLQAYGTDTNPMKLEDIYNDDKNNGYGIVDKINDVYFLYGKILIGDTSNQTEYSDDSIVAVFANAKVSSSLYEIKWIVDSAQTSTFSLTNSVLSSAGQAFKLDLSDSYGSGNATFKNNTVKNASTITFSDDVDVEGNTFNACGMITPNSAVFKDNTIMNPSDANGALYMTDDTNISGVSFYNYNGKIAIRVPASVTTLHLNGFYFDGSGTDLYWEGTSGTLTVYNDNGSNLDQSRTSSAGGTVYVPPQSYTLTLTGLEDGTEVRIYKQSDMTELAGEESVTGGKFSYTYDYNGDVPVYIAIFNLDYDPIYMSYTLTNSNNTIPIQQTKDRWYYNPP